MLLRTLKTKPNGLMLLGLAFLVLANTASVFLRRSGLASENVVDFIMGTLMGAAIATLLLWVVVRGRNARRG